METQPDSDVCSACDSELIWDAQMRLYVEKNSGMPMCYPKGQVLGNMSHRPRSVE
jgi:hypothetical protein